jgi:hypothetical protein
MKKLRNQIATIIPDTDPTDQISSGSTTLYNMHTYMPVRYLLEEYSNGMNSPERMAEKQFKIFANMFFFTYRLRSEAYIVYKKGLAVDHCTVLKSHHPLSAGNTQLNSILKRSYVY